MPSQEKLLAWEQCPRHCCRCSDSRRSGSRRRSLQNPRNDVKCWSLPPLIAYFLLPCANLGRSLSGVADAPNRTRSIVAHQQRPVRSCGYTDWSPPDTFIVHYKPGEKILVLAAGVAGLVEWNANHFISPARRNPPPAAFP